jgi:hypothetical protein
MKSASFKQFVPQPTTASTTASDESVSLKTSWVGMAMYCDLCLFFEKLCLAGWHKVVQKSFF